MHCQVVKGTQPKRDAQLYAPLFGIVEYSRLCGLETIFDGI